MAEKELSNGTEVVAALVILGLVPPVKAEQITDRFRELAKRYHPDAPNGDHETFQKISSAYETLKRSESNLGEVRFELVTGRAQTRAAAHVEESASLRKEIASLKSQLTVALQAPSRRHRQSSWPYLAMISIPLLAFIAGGVLAFRIWRAPAPPLEPTLGPSSYQVGITPLRSISYVDASKWTYDKPEILGAGCTAVATSSTIVLQESATIEKTRLVRPNFRLAVQEVLIKRTPTPTPTATPGPPLLASGALLDALSSRLPVPTRVTGPTRRAPGQPAPASPGVGTGAKTAPASSPLKPAPTGGSAKK